MPNLGMIMPNMGTERTRSRGKPTASLSDALFSRTQQRLFGLLFGQPERSFYATELIGLTGAGSGAVQRELARLAESGLVTVRAVGKQKHFQANPKSPVYAELCAIVRKTVGLAQPLREALLPLAPQIHAAFVYGSVAKRRDTAASDVDLMLVSDSLSYGDVFAALEAASTTLGRTVNPTILTRREIKKRVEQDSAFVKRVLSQPKMWLIGTEDAVAV